MLSWYWRRRKRKNHKEKQGKNQIKSGLYSSGIYLYSSWSYFRCFGRNIVSTSENLENLSSESNIFLKTIALHQKENWYMAETLKSHVITNFLDQKSIKNLVERK